MGRRTHGAIYLPEIAKGQGWTKEECIDSLLLKAGFTGTGPSKLREEKAFLSPDIRALVLQ